MRKIIITGGNEGIGFHMVKQFLKDGHMVAVIDLNLNNLHLLKETYPNSLVFFECDVRDRHKVSRSVNDAAAAFGGIDYAIHNACKCLFTSFEDTADDEYKNVFDVNYYGALNLTRAVIPIMKGQLNGRIFYASSGVGVMGFANISAYASSKGAIEALAKCMNIEYKNTGITFHIIHPPLTKTESAKPLHGVPEDFKADPQVVGTGIAKNIHKERFIICHSFAQLAQTKMMYLIPVKLGKFMSRLTGGKD